MKVFAVLLLFLSYTTAVNAQIMQQESECERQHISRVNKATEEFKIKNDNLDKQYDPLIDAEFKQNNDERFNALVKAENDAYNIIHAEKNARRQRDAYLEAERKERRINEIAKPARQNIDNFTGSATNSANASEAQGQELAGKSLLTEHNTQSQGRGISVTSQTPSGYAMAMLEEDPTKIIGIYENQPVSKKGDTIIVEANKKKYLLSKQTRCNGKDESYGFLYPYGNFYFVHKTIEESEKNLTLTELQTGQASSFISKNVIGFIIQESENQYKFNNISCDQSVYDKFLQFYDWQICKMTNTENVNRWNYAEYEQIIKEDTALNERIINAKLSEIFAQPVDDSTSDKLVKSFAGFDLKTSLQDWTLKTIWDETIQLQKITGVSGDCFSSMASVIASLKKESNPIMETTLDDFMKSNSKEQKLYTTETYRTFKRIWVSGLDAVGDCDKSGVIKKNILYHLLKNAPSAGEAIGLYASNITIEFSIAPEFKQSINEQIEKVKKKKQVLEKCRQEYEQKIRKASGNCLEYTRTMHTLKSGVFEQQYGSNELEEITNLLQDYVFGIKEIPECKVLSFEELRPVERNTQPSKTVDKSSTIIGYYGQIPVYKYEDSIVVNEKVYLLPLQPYQKNNKNTLTRYFIIYEGKNVKFAKPQEKPYENVKSFVGWVNYENDKYTFQKYNDDNKVPGLNYFGSIYIGPNNPENPNCTPNFDIPYQDAIDVAAMEHDKCYDKKGAKGATGALFNTGVIDCDEDLVAACASYIPDGSLNDKVKNLVESTVKWTYNPDLKTRATLVAAGFNNILLTKYTMIFANNVIANYGEREIKKYDLLNEQKNKESVSSQKIIYSAPTTLISTSGEQFKVIEGDAFEGEMKDGKIVQGKVIRNGETVKIF